MNNNSETVHETSLFTSIDWPQALTLTIVPGDPAVDISTYKLVQNINNCWLSNIQLSTHKSTFFVLEFSF